MELIGRRRDRSTAHAAASHGEDLLGLLLDSGIDEGQVCDELVTMIIAGHETVATALTWTLMLLAEEGRVQEAVRSELGAKDAPPSLLDYGEALPWTRAVIDEALRLYPPAWVISRRAEAADVICDRIVPAGTMVIVSPWLLHRRGDIWDEPSAFRPERFLARDAGQAASFPSYLPFGQGPRLCIGRAFALGEMVVVLSRLLGRYRLSVTSAWQRPQPQARVALQPRNGMPLVLTRLPRGADD
jgi:cytochrome P450